MSQTAIVHLPDDFDESKTAGTACGLVFGGEGWSSDRDAVLTDPEEIDDVTCFLCKAEI